MFVVPPGHKVATTYNVYLFAPSSVQLLQHRGNVDQAELAAKVADDRSIVQHQELTDALTIAALAQVDDLKQVPEVEVPEGDAALAPCHQKRL